MSDSPVIQIPITAAQAWEVFYGLSDIRDCNLLTPNQMAAIQVINAAIMAALHEVTPTPARGNAETLLRATSQRG